MNRRQRIIVSVTGIFIVLLILIGLTYAYYLTRITGNSNNTSISVTMANLELLYGDGNGILSPANKLIPGTDVQFLDEEGNLVTSKTFSVENKGNKDIDEYAVVIQNFSLKYAKSGKTISGETVTEGQQTSLAFPETMRIIVSCTSSLGANGSCIKETDFMFPEEDDVLFTTSIKNKEKQEYTVKMRYEEAGEDQSEDMNKKFSALINIIDPKSTVDIEGEVDPALVDSNTDFLQINSEPKTSRLVYDSENNVYKYKVVGVKADNHTIGIYSTEDGGTAKGSSELSIVKGTKASVVGNVITITDESRTVNVNITSDYSNEIDANIRDYIPFKKGSLAHKIVENAQKVTDEEKIKLYAEYSEPKTTVAESISAADESVLATAPEGDGVSYYFRGNVKNNYVNFAGMCWRVVRTEADGSVRLIMEDAAAECDETDPGNETVGFLDHYTGNWNVCRENKSADWYSNHPDSTCIYGISSIFLGSAQIMPQLKSFEKAVFGKNTPLKSTKLCLNTKNGYDSEGNQLSAATKEQYLESVGMEFYPERAFYYKNAIRYYGIGQAKGATFDCEDDGSNQTYKVFPITADEIIYAGGKMDEANPNFYFVNRNTNLGTFWTQTLTNFDGYFNKGVTLDINGYMSTYGTDGPHYVRPAISLISSVEFKSGDGSIENPYEIRY